VRVCVCVCVEGKNRKFQQKIDMANNNYGNINRASKELSENATKRETRRTLKQRCFPSTRDMLNDLNTCNSRSYIIKVFLNKYLHLNYALNSSK